MLTDNTFILLYRKLLKNPIFIKAELLQLFIYCLLKANHKNNEFIFNGTMLNVKRGCFIGGINQIGKDLKCNQNTVYKRLKYLEKLKYIHIDSNTKFSIIEVINYSNYQKKMLTKKKQKGQKGKNENPAKPIISKEITGIDNTESKNKVKTKEKQSKTNNNVNNINNIYSEIANNYVYQIAYVIAGYRNEPEPVNQIFTFVNKIIKLNPEPEKYKIAFMLLVYVLKCKDKFNSGLPYSYFNSFFGMLIYTDFRKTIFDTKPKQQTTNEIQFIKTTKKDLENGNI